MPKLFVIISHEGKEEIRLTTSHVLTCGVYRGLITGFYEYRKEIK